jgi:uncharacterized membrane protein
MDLKGGMALDGRRLRWFAVVLAAAGFVDSLYLTWLKVTGSTAACSNIGDCDTVNNSVYAEIYGIPIALIGALGYLLVMGLLLLEVRFDARRENIHVALFGLTLVGTIYSAYLTYLEVAVLRAVCPFCVVSAILMTILFGIAILRLFDEHEGWRGG